MVCLINKPADNKTAAIYRPRQPLESDFHRLIREHFDDFRAVYPDRYARQFGFWRPVITKAVHEFLKCGDLHHGFARVRCPDCRHEFLVAFSCKQRGICPSCAQKRTLLFGLHVAEDICRPVPHRQFVWTIPKRLRIFFRFHRGLLNRLPPLAWETIWEVYRALLGQNALPGGVLAIQTFGALIHFHPHLHGLVTDGAFAPDGRFLPLPVNLTHEPFLRLWEEKVFRLLLDEGRIEPALVAQIRSWRHSGFFVDRSVRLPAGDKDTMERLAQYMARSPFSLARLVRITPAGQVLYKAEKQPCQRYPEPVSEDLFGGVARNFQVFEPLDFLAELTQHIPNRGEHLIRYYGCYSNKTRGLQARRVRLGVPFRGLIPDDGSPRRTLHIPDHPQPEPGQQDQDQPSVAPQDRLARRRWAMLIKRIYQADPLLCPKCGGSMKIISFVEARQGDAIRRLLEHCGLWHDPPSRAPPRPPPSLLGRGGGRVQLPSLETAQAIPDTDPGITREADPDFLEYTRREEQDQPELFGDF